MQKCFEMTRVHFRLRHVKFFQLLQKLLTETLSMLQKVYGEEEMCPEKMFSNDKSTGKV